MATSPETAKQIEAALSPAGNVSLKKMFGEYGVFRDGKMVAVIADDQLFLKDSTVAQAFRERCTMAPPYPGARNYLLVPSSDWNSEWLLQAFVDTCLALPAPKPKKKKKNGLPT